MGIRRFGGRSPFFNGATKSVLVQDAKIIVHECPLAEKRLHLGKASSWQRRQSHEGRLLSKAIRRPRLFEIIGIRETIYPQKLRRSASSVVREVGHDFLRDRVRQSTCKRSLA